jgi:hypothetical protein
MSTRFYFPSGVSTVSLPCSHRINVAKKASRLAQPGFGDNARTIGFADISDQCCISLLSDPRNGASLRPDTVELNADEIAFELGVHSSTQRSLQSVLETLQALTADKA